MDKPLKILHVEDNTADATLIERALRRSELLFVIKVVDNKINYQNALVRFQPDIVLADHSLPFFNSLEALLLLKERQSNIPFILLTATMSEEFAVDMMKYGAADYVLKDRMARLPNAILNAYNKYLLDQEKAQHLNKILASQALMKEAEQLAHFGSWELNLQTKSITWSDECYHLLDYTPGEITMSLGRYLTQVHPDDLALVLKALDEVFNNDHSQEINYRVITKNSLIKHLHSKMIVTKNQDNQPKSIVGFNQDITETLTTQKKLHQSEANLSTILNNAETAYILIDTNLNIVSYNKIAVDYAKYIFNKDLEENTPALSYINYDRLSTIKDIIKKTVSGQTISYEVCYPVEKADSKWFFVRWFNISHSDKSNLGLMMEVTDITERKAAEIKLEKISNDLIRRNTTLEHFAFVVSHNLRVPIANIIGLSDLMNIEREEHSNELIKEYVDALSTSGKQLDKVVYDLNQILKLSNKENEKLEDVNIIELVEDIALVIRSSIIRENAVIRYDLLEQENIKTIKSYLYSILYNLIVNSIKFRQYMLTPVITISSFKKDNSVSLVVNDNGRGIDLKKYGDRLFGMYQRFDTSVEGEGMGLCLVKAEVNELGGLISVDSEVDKGTTFTISLPA